MGQRQPRVTADEIIRALILIQKEHFFLVPFKL